MTNYESKRYQEDWPGLESIYPLDIADCMEVGRQSFRNRLPTAHAGFFMKQVREWAGTKFGQIPGAQSLVVSKEIIMPNAEGRKLVFNNIHIESAYNPSGAGHALVTVIDWDGDAALPLGVVVREGPVSFESEQNIDVSRTTIWQSGKRQPAYMDSRTVHSAPSLEGLNISSPLTRVMISATVELSTPIS